MRLRGGIRKHETQGLNMRLGMSAQLGTHQIKDVVFLLNHILLCIVLIVLFTVYHTINCFTIHFSTQVFVAHL